MPVSNTAPADIHQPLPFTFSPQTYSTIGIPQQYGMPAMAPFPPSPFHQTPYTHQYQPTHLTWPTTPRHETSMPSQSSPLALSHAIQWTPNVGLGSPGPSTPTPVGGSPAPVQGRYQQIRWVTQEEGRGTRRGGRGGRGRGRGQGAE